MYVSSFAFRSVYRWDLDGNYIDKPGDIPVTPGGNNPALLFMTFRPNGNLLVCGENIGTDELQNDDSSTPWTHLGTFSKNASQDPDTTHRRGVSIGPDGNIYVTHGGAAVERYASDGMLDLAWVISGLATFLGDVEFFNDDLLVAQQSTISGPALPIKRFDRETRTPKVDISPGGSNLYFADDLLLLANGTLLVANTGGPSAGFASQVLKFDAASGAFLDVFADLPAGEFARGLAFVPAAAAAPDASSIVSVASDSNNMISVTFSSVSGQVYDVQIESDLVDGTWTNDPSNENISGTGTSITVKVNSDPGTQGVRVSTEFE